MADKPFILHRQVDSIAERLRDDRPVHIEIAGDTKPGLFDRIADALGTERGFSFFLGFYSGTMFCCGTMILWAVVL